jgi:membrane protein
MLGGSALNGVLDRVDAFQRRHGALAQLVAVIKKFTEDRAGRLAALVAYYGFFSLFPLLLVLVTGIGFVLGGDSALRREIVDSALAQFPVVGRQIELRELDGSGLALIVGVLTSLWAGLGAMQAMEAAMNEIWDIPIKDQPNFLASRLKGLAMLGVLGAGLIGAVAVASIGAFSDRLGLIGTLGSLVVAVVVVTAIFLVSFRILPSADQPWRALVPGAVVAGVGFVVLQLLGGLYVDRAVSGASEAYGVFALVIGLLSWLHLLAKMAILAAEVNVVRHLELWPRSLHGDDLTEADERALRRYAKSEERRDDEHVDMTIREDVPAPEDPTSVRA